MGVALLLLIACVARWGETGPGDPVDSSGTIPTPVDDSATLPDPLVVPLRWVRGYEGDTWAAARTGVWWQLAHLGAVPPPDEPGLTVVSESEDEVRFTLDLAAVGFPEPALGAVTEAVAFVPTTDEQGLYGGLDLGAFFLRTLYEPWHYYRVTGACGTDAAWRAAHLAPDPAVYAITDSLLVDGDRLNQYTRAPSEMADIAHVAEEGPGSIADGTFAPIESESIDLLPNGMLRYAVYDASGVLQPWATASPAGQPGRCMWCHEDHLQRGLETNPGVEGYVQAAEFVADVDAQTAVIATLRAGLPTAVYADPVVAHAQGELLTETWLLPSPGRLAREWFVDEARVADALAAAAVPTTTDPEYPEFGALVTRADADRVFAELLPTLVADPAHPLYGKPAAYTPVETLPSAREAATAPLVWGDPATLPCD